jgi:hypothetical protein
VKERSDRRGGGRGEGGGRRKGSGRQRDARERQVDFPTTLFSLLDSIYFGDEKRKITP